MQLHLQPTGKQESLQVTAGFYFTDGAPTRAPIGLRLGSETIDIPPGNDAWAIADRYQLPVDVEVFAIQPHAHNLARTMQAMAILPDGSRRWLIAIDDWDFRWQDVYRYTAPIALPKGTVIEPHSHDTENVGVITQGELFLVVDGKETRYGPGDWYHLPAHVMHSARFDVETSEIEFWFRER